MQKYSDIYPTVRVYIYLPNPGVYVEGVVDLRYDGCDSQGRPADVCNVVLENGSVVSGTRTEFLCPVPKVKFPIPQSKRMAA